MVSTAVALLACFICFRIGVIWERWASGISNVEEYAFSAGYEKGFEEGASETFYDQLSEHYKVLR